MTDMASHVQSKTRVAACVRQSETRKRPGAWCSREESSTSPMHFGEWGEEGAGGILVATTWGPTHGGGGPPSRRVPSGASPVEAEGA